MNNMLDDLKKDFDQLQPRHCEITTKLTEKADKMQELYNTVYSHLSGLERSNKNLAVRVTNGMSLESLANLQASNIIWELRQDAKFNQFLEQEKTMRDDLTALLDALEVSQ